MGIFDAVCGETRGALYDLVGKPPTEIRVALIPTANYPVIDKEYIAAVISDFGLLGMAVNVVDLKEENERTLDEKLSPADVIYVDGGNPYWLLDWARESGFDRVIRRLLDQGKTYVGVSAGSLITGPDIGYLRRAEGSKTDVVDIAALGLVEFGILPHYTYDDPSCLASWSRDVAFPIVALTDRQVVLVNGGECRIIGGDSKVTFNGFHETR